MIAKALMALALLAGDPLADPTSPPPEGTISIDATTLAGSIGPSKAVFVNAITDALAARGFTLIEQAGHARFVADVNLSRDQVGDVPAAATKSKPSVLGPGITFSLPTGKSRIVPLQRTRMEIRIRRQGETAIVWQGAALTVRPGATPRGQDSTVATDLSAAVLRAYPTLTGQEISIP